MTTLTWMNIIRNGEKIGLSAEGILNTLKSHGEKEEKRMTEFFEQEMKHMEVFRKEFDEFMEELKC